MKAIWLCEDEQARWFEFEEPFDMPDAVTVTKMVPERGPLTDEQAETAFKAWHYKHGNNTQGIKWVDDLLRSCWKAAIEAAHAKGDA